MALALEFYTEALGAQELFRTPSPDGGVGYAEFIKMIDEGKFRLTQMPSEPLSFFSEGQRFFNGFSVVIVEAVV